MLCSWLLTCSCCYLNLLISNKMKYLKNFNIPRFKKLNIIIGALTLLSLLAAWQKDEGTLGKGFFPNFLADSFNIFRFPTHVLFWSFLSNGSSALFSLLYLVALLINVLFYSFLIESIISIFIKHK